MLSQFNMNCFIVSRDEMSGVIHLSITSGQVQGDCHILPSERTSMERLVSPEHMALFVFIQTLIGVSSPVRNDGFLSTY